MPDSGMPLRMRSKRLSSSGARCSLGRRRLAPVPPPPCIPWQRAHCPSNRRLPRAWSGVGAGAALTAGELVLSEFAFREGDWLNAPAARTQIKRQLRPATQTLCPPFRGLSRGSRNGISLLLRRLATELYYPTTPQLRQRSQKECADRPSPAGVFDAGRVPFPLFSIGGPPPPVPSTRLASSPPCLCSASPTPPAAKAAKRRTSRKRCCFCRR